MFFRNIWICCPLILGSWLNKLNPAFLHRVRKKWFRRILYYQYLCNFTHMYVFLCALSARVCNFQQLGNDPKIWLIGSKLHTKYFYFVEVLFCTSINFQITGLKGFQCGWKNSKTSTAKRNIEFFTSLHGIVKGTFLFLLRT